MTLNKCIAKCRELFNKLNETEASKHHSKVYLSLELLKLLSPITPHICEELWHNMQESLGDKSGNLLCSVLLSNVNSDYLVKNVAKIAVQIGGKLKGVVEVKIDCEQEDVVKMASSINSVKAILDTGGIKKVIFVKNKILNFIT
jgi:leucyl-tRNA synthetase